MSDREKFLVGASRTCITPGPEYFPIEHFRNHMNGGKPSIFSGKIRDDIFLRIVIIDRDNTRLVWAVLDLPGVPESESVRQLIADCAGVAETQVIYTCTHNHSGLYADNPVFEKWYGEPFATKVHRYRQFLRDIIPGAVKKAEDDMRPAVMGIRRGSCYLNVNRNEKELGPKAQTYGFRVDGPTDHDLYIIRFDDLEGKTIAMMYNFCVHACMMIHNDPEGRGTEISGDFVGYACRLIERKYHDEAVVMFTSGAAGDMNPIMMSRVNIVEPDGNVTTRDLGAAGPIILEFMGKRLARDILKVNRELICDNPSPVLWGDAKTFKLPSSVLEMPGPDRTVPIRIGLMMLGENAIIVSNGEVYNQIGRRFKERMPFRNAFMVTHAGAWLGYIRDDSGDGIYETETAKVLDELVKEYINR